MAEKKKGRGRPKMAPEKKRVSVHYTISPDADKFIKKEAKKKKTSVSDIVDTHFISQLPKKKSHDQP